MVRIKQLDDTYRNAIEFGQKCLKSHPSIILGSGASVSVKIPDMGKLAIELKENVNVDNLTVKDQKLWAKISTEFEKSDIESVLNKNNNNISEELLGEIINEIWKIINAADLSALNEIFCSDNILPLGKLFEYLFDCSRMNIDVVTTNYDRIAEYATCKIKALYFKGFSNGYISSQVISSSPQKAPVSKKEKTVNIWKVHGCLDWFQKDQFHTNGLSLSTAIPNNYKPCIVTPGISKYEQASHSPFRDIIYQADRIFDEASAFICIGYGFNDSHIQEKLIQRVNNSKKVPLLILTKKISSSTKKIIEKLEYENYIAFEQIDENTRMITKLYPKGKILKNINLWSLSNFLNETIGV